MCSYNYLVGFEIRLLITMTIVAFAIILTHHLGSLTLLVGGGGGSVFYHT